MARYTFPGRGTLCVASGLVSSHYVFSSTRSSAGRVVTPGALHLRTLEALLVAGGWMQTNRQTDEQTNRRTVGSVSTHAAQIAIRLSLLN